MNAIEINALSTAALRELAKEMGVKRAANDTKATLAAKVIAALPIEDAPEVVELTVIEGTPAELIELLEDTAAKADADAQAAEYAAKLKEAKKANKCTICFTRTVGTGKGSDPKHAKSMGYCAPCLEEAEWENTHSDENHEGIVAAMGPSAADANEMIKGCWVCHPELNEAQKAFRVTTTGRSRAGMKIWAKGTNFHKSELVAKAIEAAGGTATIKTNKHGDITNLTGEVAGVEIKMGWDGNAFAYGERSIINGKQQRNVAAALRVIAGLAAKK